MKTHIHHIVPKYICKKLGIDPDFEGNHVEISVEQHAEIHWGYSQRDLSPLLKVCTPSQEILDMIELGNSLDASAANLISETINYDITGENNPNYKDGKFVGRLEDPELYKKIDKQRHLERWGKNRVPGCPRMRFFYFKRKGDRVNAEHNFNEWKANAPMKSKNRQSLWPTDTFEMWWYRQGNDLNFRENIQKNGTLNQFFA